MAKDLASAEQQALLDRARSASDDLREALAKVSALDAQIDRLIVALRKRNVTTNDLVREIAKVRAMTLSPATRRRLNDAIRQRRAVAQKRVTRAGSRSRTVRRRAGSARRELAEFANLLEAHKKAYRSMQRRRREFVAAVEDAHQAGCEYRVIAAHLVCASEQSIEAEAARLRQQSSRARRRSPQVP
jgi:hypothetical protein